MKYTPVIFYKCSMNGIRLLNSICGSVTANFNAGSMSWNYFTYISISPGKYHILQLFRLTELLIYC